MQVDAGVAVDLEVDEARHGQALTARLEAGRGDRAVDHVDVAADDPPAHERLAHAKPHAHKFPCRARVGEHRLGDQGVATEGGTYVRSCR